MYIVIQNCVKKRKNRMKKEFQVKRNICILTIKKRAPPESTGISPR